jgi:protein-L-isoaspartate(D-aspartate) O-methyltransferase
MSSWFIPSVGASSTKDSTKVPGARQARNIRAAWLTSEKPPDETAAPIYPYIWFSLAKTG